MINLSNDDSIIGYLSWAEANDIDPFGNKTTEVETNIFDDIYDTEVEDKPKVKSKNNNNFRHW